MKLTKKLGKKRMKYANMLFCVAMVFFMIYFLRNRLMETFCPCGTDLTKEKFKENFCPCGTDLTKEKFSEEEFLEEEFSNCPDNCDKYKRYSLRYLYTQPCESKPCTSNRKYPYFLSPHKNYL